MILIRYFLKEICKNQLLILSLLFLVCFCQKLIKLMGLHNNISICSIFLYLICYLPELGKLIVPFSLFLSILITCYRLHIRNEILAMYSCAVSKYVFIQSILFYSSMIAFLASINMFYLSAYCEQYRNKMLFEIKKNIHFIELLEKKFQFLFDKSLILFVESIKNKKMYHIVVVKKKYDKDSNILEIITAQQGKFCCRSDNIQLIFLKKGVFYEIYSDKQVYTDICISSFYKHEVLINNNSKFLLENKDMIDCMSLKELWNSSLLEARIEFNWRLTLLVSIFIMPIISFLLMMNIVDSYVLNFLLAIILYVVFFMLHILLRTNAVLTQINPIVWMWIINLFYVVIIFLINFWKIIRLKICKKVQFLFLFLFTR